MNNSNYKKRCNGIALVMVLLVVGTIAIVAIGFIARGDMELSCGENMVTKAAIDYLAESGLEHGRGLILNPQDVDTEFWAGDTRMQLDANSNDYYDVAVTKTGYCDYTIESTAYCEINGKIVAQTSLIGQLRIDHSIGLRTGESWISESITTVYGDVCVRGDFTGWASIYGDAFAKKQITTPNILGSKMEDVPDEQIAITFPDWKADDFQGSYRIGASTYTAGTVSSPLQNTVIGPTASNPAGIYFYFGNLEIMDNVTINGTLAVKGELKIRGTNNAITAHKNFPAVVADNKLKMYDDSQLTVNGLVYVRNDLKGNAYPNNAHLTVVGALFLKNDIDNMTDSSNSITITADPDIAAVKIWSSSSEYTKWSLANGAFFKSITRVQ